MSFILFRYDDKYRRSTLGRWKFDLSDVCWLGLRCNSTLMMFSRAWDQQRWECLHVSLSPGCLLSYPSDVCSAQVYLSTDRSASLRMVYSLIDSLLYLLYSQFWNYARLNRGKQAKWMKSSDIVTLISPIRFLPSSFTPSLFSTSKCFSNRMWPSHDGQIITLHEVS